MTKNWVKSLTNSELLTYKKHIGSNKSGVYTGVKREALKEINGEISKRKDSGKMRKDAGKRKSSGGSLFGWESRF